MLFDQTLIETYRNRTAVDDSIGALIDAWSERSPDCRAAMLVARGDIQRAALCGREGWKQLAGGDMLGALRVSRETQPKSQAMYLLESEGLLGIGAIAAGLEHLEMLHQHGDAAASISLARRRHLLGDHLGAERVARMLPMHIQVALIGARAALANHRTEPAFEFIVPFLNGSAPISEPIVAGSIAVITATVLAQREEHDRLDRFARYLLSMTDLSEEMMPAIARVAWTAGLAAEAWKYFNTAETPWMIVSRLELAILAGNIALALQLIQKAGPLGAPSRVSITLLGGGHSGKKSQEMEKVFAEDAVVHIWRTHPYRWQPWIDAAMQTPAQISVFNLAKDELPDPNTLPGSVIDDGSLIDMFPPVPVPVCLNQEMGVWIEEPLCEGIGIGHNWPEKETDVIKEQIPLASSPEKAAVWILGVDLALRHVHSGHPMIVIAPPGDAFWGGALPERAWPALRIIRTEPNKGWEGAGSRVVELLNLLLKLA